MNKKLSFYLFCLFIGQGFLTSCQSFPEISTSSENNEVVSSHYKVHRLDETFFSQSLNQAKPHPEPIPHNNTSNYVYKVGAGDVLNITIWDHPELTIPAGGYRSSADSGNRVHSDGHIFYPYIGFVKVEGKTVIEVRDLLAKRLAVYIEKPQVDVNVAAFRSQKIYVTGEVARPGKQPITNVPLTLLEAVNQAGGYGANADIFSVYLTRGHETEVVSLHKLLKEGNLSQNYTLAHGDIVHVPRNDTQKVFVLGEVAKPSLLKIDRNGMSLTEALSQGGGFKPLDADARGVFVIRARHKSKAISELESKVIADVYQLDLSNALALVVGTHFKLRPMDVVFVTRSPVSRWALVLDRLVKPFSVFNTLASSVISVQKWGTIK